MMILGCGMWMQLDECESSSCMINASIFTRNRRVHIFVEELPVSALMPTNSLSAAGQAWR